MLEILGVFNEFLFNNVGFCSDVSEVRAKKSKLIYVDY